MSRLPFFKYNEIFSAPVRVLIKESHAIFITIPRDNLEMTRNNVITISRRYRSIVHECVDNLNTYIKTNPLEETQIQNQIKTFKELEIIWNLCEILLLDVNQTGTLTVQLKNWIKMHFDERTDESRNIIQALEKDNYEFSENDVPDTYWSLVIRLVLRGELKKAVQLLKCHYEFSINDQMQLVASMLERMPLSNQYIVHEFCNKWQLWSNWCKSERETGQFDNNPPLLTIVRLLSQDQDVYEQLASHCEKWYQLMVCYLLYTDPCIKATNLSELCRRSISIFKKNHPDYGVKECEPDEFDEIIIAAFEYDLIQVIANCCSYLDDNWWFVTHFVDLLHCSNQLKIHEILESDKLREHFLQDYASTLFDDDSLWAIGISYLDSCPTSGQYYLEALLSRVPLDLNDEVKAHKLISIAAKRNIHKLFSSICLLMARKWLEMIPKLDDESIKIDKYSRTSDIQLPPSVNLANALYWAIKSTDTPLTTYISDQYLYYYCKTNNFPDISVFESLKRSPLNNERLAFLTKYHEFTQTVQDPNNLVEAGNLVKALLTSGICPRFFSSRLLYETRSLLETRPQLVFPPDKTIELMKSIEDLNNDNHESDTNLSKNLIYHMARALITPVGVEKSLR